MRRLLTGVVIGLILLSCAAWKIQHEIPDGKTHLVWVSDGIACRYSELELFNRLNSTYRVDLDPNNLGMAKVIVQSLGGVGPDMFDCYSAMELSGYVNSGVAWDITDELRKRGLDINKEVWASVLPLAVYDGRVYGWVSGAAAQGIWFNKDAFDRQGLQYPQSPMSWNELLPIAKQLTIRDNNGQVKQFGLLLDWWGVWQQFIWQWGGRIFTEDGTRCIVDSPEASSGIQFLQDLIYKYHVSPTPSEESAATQGGYVSGCIDWFGAGRGATAIGGRWWIIVLKKYKGLNLGVVEGPYGPGGRKYLGYGRGTIINKHSPKRYDALKFIEYLAGRDYCEFMNHEAGGISPVMKYCYTPKYAAERVYPEGDGNIVWRDLMKDSFPDETSPFVSGHVVLRLLSIQLDLVRNKEKTAEAAMRTAARQINAEIQQNLDSDPALRARYDLLVRRDRL